MTYYLHHPFRRVTLLAVLWDLVCLTVIAGAVWVLAGPALSPVAFVLGTAALALVSFALMGMLDCYPPEVLADPRRTVEAGVKVMAGSAVGFGFASLAAPALLSEVAIFAALAAGFHILVLATRPLLRKSILRPELKKRAIILGASELGIAVADGIAERRGVGIELVGFLVGEDDLPRGVAGYPVIGRLHQLEKVINNAGIDIVVVASKRRDETLPADQLLQAKLRGLEIHSGVSFYERLTGRVHLRELRPSYLVFSKGFVTGRAADVLCRATDIAVSVIGLVIAAPLLLLAAAAIKIDSRGPVLYRQERMGRHGRPFHVVKLRTMRQDAEKNGPVFTVQGDRRVTRVGHVLRMTRLDEVPQYWNVLRGEMALVGPRPERPEFFEMLSARYPFFRLRTACKPGLTGWAQVRHGYVNRIDGFEDKLGLDLYYLKHRSPLMDLAIILQTIKTVVLLRGL